MLEKLYTSPTQPTPQTSTPRGEDFREQSVMPTPQPEQKPPSKSKTIIIILIIIAVVAILVFGFVWAYPKYFQPNKNENVNQTVNTVVNENKNINVNLNENVNIEANTNTPLNINKVLPSNLDNDHDGLTNLEEEALTTERQNPDTDGDGYTDSDELRNGYNPIGAGSLITTAGLYKSYTDKEFSYLIFYPLNFQFKKDTKSGKLAFLAPTEEIIYLEIEDVPSDITTALDFYLSKNPEVDKSKVKTITNWYNLEGILSIDGKRAYYLKDNKAFIVTYQYEETASYESIFEMVYRSFKSVILADTNVDLE